MAKKKRTLYEEFIKRQGAALAAGQHLESAWYAYSVLEDRLRSMLRSTGGEMTAKKKLIEMLGPKLKALKTRAESDQLLAANLDYSGLDKWRDDRNKLTHKMAEGSVTIQQIDKDAEQLAKDGVRLVRETSAAATRLKKHRKKVSP